MPAYVPWTRKQPPARELIVAAAEPALILCEARARECWRVYGPCLAMDELTPSAGQRTRCPPDAEAVACVIFTSGSTGVPKGVEVLQRGLVNHALAIGRLYQLAARTRLCAASVASICSFQLYCPRSGAEVVMRPAYLFDSLTASSFLRSWASAR